MSGYTDFFGWIDSSAGNLFYKDESQEIEKTFFTSAPGHNSDHFNIKLKNGPTISAGKPNWNDVNWDDLRIRFEESKKV